MRNRIIKFIRRDKWPIMAAVCAALIISSVWAGLSLYASSAQNGIAGGVIRLHVRANSDSEEDQALKLKARDAALAYIGGITDGAEDIGAARLILINHMRDIEAAAAAAVKESGGDYAVLAYLTKDTFPTKSYENVTLPAGKYEALRVDIGAAEGGNWWCVVYPALCFPAAVKENTGGESCDKLKGVLTAEQFNLVTGKNKVKFKIVEMFSKKK